MAGVKVANRRGDLDAYAVHFRNKQEFGGGKLKWLWNCISKRMREMLPAACAGMAAEMSRARVQDRLYSEIARDVVSDDLLVCNIGVSSAYQSPAHMDPRDTGWTFAFSVKCNHEGTEDEQGRGKRYRSNSEGDGPTSCNATRSRAHHIDKMASWKTPDRVRADIRSMTSWATLRVEQANGTKREYTMCGDYFEMQFRKKEGAAAGGNGPFAQQDGICGARDRISGARDRKPRGEARKYGARERISGAWDRISGDRERI